MLLNIPLDESDSLEVIDSIDKAAERLDHSLESSKKEYKVFSIRINRNINDNELKEN